MRQLSGGVALLVLATGVARAGEPLHRSRLQLDFGLASAVGELGASYAFRPVQPFEIEVGAGIGFTGLQLSAMPRLLIGSARSALAIGAGLSFAPSVKSVGTDPERGNFDYSQGVPWFNAEVGWEYESDSGFALLLAGGLTVSLGEGEIPGIDQGVELSGLVSPTLRVGLGYAF